MFAPPKLKPDEVRNFVTYQKHVEKDHYGDKSTSVGRFRQRVNNWVDVDHGYMTHHLWWLLHNCVAHPALGLVPCQKTVDFHDWTSDKLNHHAPYWDKTPTPSKSPLPVIPNRWRWIEHNVIAHMGIGLVPCTKTFWYHDVTALDQNVKGWV